MANKTPLPGVQLSASDWEKIYWKDGSQDPYFHLKHYHKTVEKYYSQLSLQSKGRVFLPLCGKTLDLIFFEERGHEVVGVEFSEVAIRGFFEEQNLEFTKDQMIDAPFILYKAVGKDITIYQGDFFKIKQEICGRFDAIWDRGGFVAINEEDRMRYSDIMFDLMKPNARYLLQSLNYDASRFAGPPHYVTDEELKETLGRKCHARELEGNQIIPPYIDDPNLDWSYSIYILTLKQ